MAFVEGAEYDPIEMEKYVVGHKDFFKRWTLQNITLNQLNAILLEQQMMPSSAAVAFPGGEEGGKPDEEADATNVTALAEISKQVNGCETYLSNPAYIITQPKDGRPFSTYSRSLRLVVMFYPVMQKTAPFYFCNSFVKTSSIMTIFGKHIQP